MDSSTHSPFGTKTSDGTATSGLPNTGSPSAHADASGIAGGVKNAASTAGDTPADVGSAVRDKAGNVKTTVADALESGAERLRQHNAGGAQLAGAGLGGAEPLTEDSRIAQASNQLAGGMQHTADWLRDADLDGLKSGIERQVKEYPVRSLAVAVGIGYLLGKVLRD